MAGKPAFQVQSIWHQAARAYGATWEPWRRSLAVYWGFVTLLGELLGRVLNRLDALGLTDDTIVVMVSDHGKQMGSHGLFQKSCMYEKTLRVPCLLRSPRLLPAGRRLAAPISLLDLAPMLLALTGLDGPGRELLQPQSSDRSGWLTGAEPVPAACLGAADDQAAGAVFSEYKPYAGEQMTDIRAIIGPRYKNAWNR